MRVDDMFSGNNEAQLIDQGIDREIDNLEMLGYDINDTEFMGALFKRLIGAIKARRSGKKGLISRIVSRVKKRKAAKRGKKSGYGIKLMSPEGTATLTPEGISYEEQQKMIEAGLIPKPGIQQAGILDQLKENPMLLAIPAIGLLLLMKMKQSPKS